MCRLSPCLIFRMIGRTMYPRRGDKSMSVKTNIIKIGNSQGIRIPKPLLEQVGLSGEVELEVQADTLLRVRVGKNNLNTWPRRAMTDFSMASNSMLPRGTRMSGNGEAVRRVFGESRPHCGSGNSKDAALHHRLAGRNQQPAGHNHHRPHDHARPRLSNARDVRVRRHRRSGRA